MPKINQAQIRAWRIPLPPLDEQVKLVQYVRAENRTLDAAAIRARREIELLQEFKARLTADVVTGQVDVREVAARLPNLDPSELAETVRTGVDDDLDEQAEESLEDVET